MDELLSIERPTGNIEFIVPDPKTDRNRVIVKLCGNGDIFVKGKLIENDKELVDGLREFLLIMKEYR